MLIGLLGKSNSGKDTVASTIAPVHLVRMDGQWVDIEARVDTELAVQRRRSALKSRAVQLALADPLKVICRDVYDFSYMQLWGPSAARNTPDKRYPRTHAEHDLVGGVCQRCRIDITKQATTYGPCVDDLTPREALQELGTQWGRERYPNTWIDLGVRRARELTGDQRVRQPVGAEHFAASYVIERTELVLLSDVRFANEVAAIRAAGGEVWKIKRPEAGLSGAAGAHLSETEQDGIDEALFDHVIVNDGTIADLRAKCAVLL